MADMSPADVPDEWLDAFEAGIDDFDGPDRDGYRRGLAAVLALHQRKVRAGIVAELEARAADCKARGLQGRAVYTAAAARYISCDPEGERNEQRTRATIAEAAATALRGQRDAAKTRAEQAEAEVARLRKANVATAAEYDAALLAIHEARDHWQNRAAAEFERAEQAEAALAEMQREFGVINAEWGVQWPDHNATKKIGEGEARAIVRNDRAATLRRRLVGEWQDYKPEPRTALERAADEQGDGGGGGDA